MSLDNGYLSLEELEVEAGRKMSIEKINEYTPSDTLNKIKDYMEGATAYCLFLREVWVSQSASPFHESALYERLDS